MESENGMDGSQVLSGEQRSGAGETGRQRRTGADQRDADDHGAGRRGRVPLSADRQTGRRGGRPVAGGAQRHQSRLRQRRPSAASASRADARRPRPPILAPLGGKL